MYKYHKVSLKMIYLPKSIKWNCPDQGYSRKMERVNSISDGVNLEEAAENKVKEEQMEGGASSGAAQPAAQRNNAGN